MNFRTLFGALVAAGVIGGVTGYGVAHGPFSPAQAAAPVVAAGVAAPAANPAATTLPLNGFSDLVKKYGPAVVNVRVEGTRKTASQAMPEVPEQFRDFFKDFRGRIPMPRGGDIPMQGQGSGFIVSSDGYVITNAHVVENADTVTIRLTDRREYRAKVVGTDKQTDIAVLKLDVKEPLPSVKLGSSANASVGEWLVAIGSPFGFENSVSAGILSAKGRSLPDATYTQFIQTDVAVNPGNSGGPLFNLAGEVIGINSQIYSRTGGFQGISFAIPIETALKVKDDLIKHGKVTRGRIGVTVQEVNAALAESFGLDRPRGALVSQVDPNAPGAKAGLQVGDIITRYDGRPIDRSADLPVLVGDTPAGKSATLEVWRKRGFTTLTVAPTNAPRETDRVAENDDGAATKGRLGLAVRPLSPEEGGRRGKGGLIVEQASGPAARAGIQPGDVVLSFNGLAVKSAEELRELVGKAGRSAALLIQRENQQIFVPVELG
jgi:serine protease Do